QYLRRFDPTRVSLQVEKLYPDLNNLLVSYVQLDGSGARPEQGSPQMIQAMRGQAARAAAPLDFSAIVNFRKLGKLLSIAGAVLLLFVVSTVFASEYYAILLGRLLNPFTTLAYPTRTKIEDVSNVVAVKQGDNVDLKALVGGEIPEEGSVFIKVGNAAW